MLKFSFRFSTVPWKTDSFTPANWFFVVLFILWYILTVMDSSWMGGTDSENRFSRRMSLYSFSSLCSKSIFSISISLNLNFSFASLGEIGIRAYLGEGQSASFVAPFIATPVFTIYEGLNGTIVVFLIIVEDPFSRSALVWFWLFSRFAWTYISFFFYSSFLIFSSSFFSFLFRFKK